MSWSTPVKTGHGALEHLELIAGSLLVVAYGMLGGAIISAIV